MIKFDISDTVHNLVPTTLEDNLAWKQEIVKAARVDKELQRLLFEACRRDILFYINGFVWTYNPRENPLSPEVPFIPYDCQVNAILEILRAIREKKDVVIEKSRYMGASWICCIVIDWLWRFVPLQSFLLVSRKEDLVDKSGDPQSLFWKLDYIHKRLPFFLKPERSRAKMIIKNLENESIISGESTTGDVARGDRRTAILLDEFAAFEIQDGYKALSATQHATNTRIINSTTTGTGTAYYDMCMKAVSEPDAIVHIRLAWYDHPIQRRGLYTSENGKLKILDPTYKFPDNYPFILDGKLRSPYYDKECKRAAHPIDIARQLDMDHMGANQLFFEASMIDGYIKEYTKEPVFIGEPAGNVLLGELRGFVKSQQGRFKFWDNRFITTPPKGNEQFVIGVDIAAGTGNSNSVLSIGVAKEVVSDTNNYVEVVKIAEFVDSLISPEDLAMLTLALARWFNNAFLIWEANGAGRPFGKKITDAGYTNLYFKKDITKLKFSGFTGIPGFYTTKETKQILLTEYREALRERTFINPSKSALEECLCYIYTQNGKIEHIDAINKMFASDAGENHGDRVVADALLLFASRDIILPVITFTQQGKEKNITNCLYARRLERLRAEQEAAMFNYIEEGLIAWM